MNFPQVFVLKDTWRDSSRNPEGDLYRKAGPGEGLANFFCDGVVVVNGIPDDTTTLVRQGITPSSNPLDLKPMTEETTNWQTDTSAVPFSHPHLVNVTSRLHGRVHSRTILATYGWPIHRFISVLEVVQALRSALKGRMVFFYWRLGAHKLLSVQDTIIYISTGFSIGI